MGWPDWKSGQIDTDLEGDWLQLLAFTLNVFLPINVALHLPVCICRRSGFLCQSETYRYLLPTLISRDGGQRTLASYFSYLLLVTVSRSRNTLTGNDIGRPSDQSTFALYAALPPIVGFIPKTARGSFLAFEHSREIAIMSLLELHLLGTGTSGCIASLLSSC